MEDICRGKRKKLEGLLADFSRQGRRDIEPYKDKRYNDARVRIEKLLREMAVFLMDSASNNPMQLGQRLPWPDCGAVRG
jgi:hypothetical protein